MGSARGSDAVAGWIIRPGTGGIVARPRLFERLGASERVTVLSGPPGSGKTVLLRSWIGAAGVADSVAWVPVGHHGCDPQQFWLSAVGALRRTVLGAALVQPLTAAPDLDGWAIVERLLKDLAPLAGWIWPVDHPRRITVTISRHNVIMAWHTDKTANAALGGPQPRHLAGHRQ